MSVAKKMFIARHRKVVTMEMESAFRGVLDKGKLTPPDKYARLEQQVPYFLSHVYSAQRIVRNGNHLDIGSGAMALAASSRSAGFSPFAIDAEFSFPEYATIAQRLGIPHTLFTVPDSGDFLSAEELEKRVFPQSYSLVSALSVQFDRHGDQVWGPQIWARFFQSVERLLAPGGLFLIKPNRHSDLIDAAHRSDEQYDTRVWRVVAAQQRGSFDHRTFGLRKEAFSKVVAKLLALSAW